MKQLRTFAGVFLWLCALPAAAELQVEDAWIREPPPVPTPLAGYLRIRNTGAVTRELVGARASAATGIEIHRTVHEQGVTRMQRLRRVELPAGSEVVLEPGGAHLMIFGVATPPRAGASLELLLEFADGECMPVRFAVVPSVGAVRGAAH